jgi:hypothetical protein
VQVHLAMFRDNARAANTLFLFINCYTNSNFVRRFIICNTGFVERKNYACMPLAVPEKRIPDARYLERSTNARAHSHIQSSVKTLMILIVLLQGKKKNVTGLIFTCIFN